MASKKAEKQTITKDDVGKVEDILTGAPVAPGAETAAPVSTPGRKKRFTFYPDGLDYILVSVQTDAQNEPMANGALSAVPGDRAGPNDAEGEPTRMPLRFGSAQEAERWVRASGDQLAGMLVICVRMQWRLRVLVKQSPVITVTKDERFEKELEAQQPVAAVVD